MALKKYHKKRDFVESPEPKGKIKDKNVLLFVVQKHDASHLHYDFRLAINGVLKSWAVPKGPCLDPTVKRLAVEVEDHPLEYAAFEGAIPKGAYGGGTVMVWDYGGWEAETDLAKAYKKGEMKFTLYGEKLSGGWHLIRTKREANKPQWLLFKNDDAYSKKLNSYDVLKKQPNSALTDRTMTQIATEEASK